MNHKFMKKFFPALIIPFCISASVVHAAEIETLNIKQQTSHYMDMKQRVTRIAVGDPSIATVVQLPGSASEFLVVTKATRGSTALFVWTIDGARHEYLIVVSPEDPGQAMMIEKAIGLPDVHVKMVGERILLTGTVENQYEKNYALQTARLFINGSTESSLLVGSGFDMTLDTDTAQSASGGRSDDIELAKSEANGTIIDLLQILHPTQIRLEAQIIEINSDDAKNLGIQYGQNAASAPGIFSFGEAYDRTQTTETYFDQTTGTVYTVSNGSNVRPFHNNPITWVRQRFAPINAQINLLVSQGKARILSRPSVMTLSGEQATIQIGGEIPYAATNTSGWTNTNFKNYGIILQFKPVVDSQNKIISAIHAEVSNMSGQAVNNQPIIATRSADSVISLNSGMPIVIGGLMDSSESKNVSKIPLLGDIPIIGEFFKHTSRTRDKRELIIVVTPYLVSEQEISQTPMSKPMREWYTKEQDYNNAREAFDFKQTEEPVLDVVEPEPRRILPPSRLPRETTTPFK
ncbi:MAG: pilus assembly protein N-terminal domain-containing protein [Selenomonadaceae bacterium]|nr:pilus assembly protein N-terminal domain-containing protein [Selenomonadaceae bacterium]